MEENSEPDTEDLIESFPFREDYSLVGEINLLHLSNERNFDEEALCNSFGSMFIQHHNPTEDEEIIEGLMNIYEEELNEMNKTDLTALCSELKIAKSNNS